MQSLQGISKEETAERRRLLSEKMPPGSLIRLQAAISQFRNKDTEYPFRQNSDFYYLTGFCEPNAVLILTKNEKGIVEFILFCEEEVPEKSIWVGPRLGVKGAVNVLGANKAYPFHTLNEIMPSLLAHHQEIEFLPILQEQRLIKSPAEIELMRTAASLSAKAHTHLMEFCQPNQKEYALEAEFEYFCHRQGARFMAYPSIVGGGKNACILHYTENNQILQSGDLVLVDAGCEYQYYASDITRTFPVNGHFSSDQKAIYEWVLKAQMAAIQAIRPGLLWEDIQAIVVSILTEGLMALGILRDAKDYKRFYMHSSGHWLGLDVHDVGSYTMDGQSRPLVPGMVLTVEPGIYIAPDQADVDKRWWGIGIRIEDDVLVTEKGYEVLSAAAPKSVERIEQLMRVKQ